jgi:hypothetical protein
LVVGVGNEDSIQIDLNEDVRNLQKMIFDQRNYNIKFNDSFDESELKLYLAAKNTTWIKSRDEDVVALRNGKIPEGIKNIISGEIMDGTATIDECIKEAKLNAPGRRQIHILVVLPPIAYHQSIQISKQITEIDPSVNNIPEPNEMTPLTNNAQSKSFLSTAKAACNTSNRKFQPLNISC